MARQDQEQAISVAELDKRLRPVRPPSRAEIAKADHIDLVRASQEQIVLGHIHPRWLRAEVARLLDAGEVVTPQRIAELRAGAAVCKFFRPERELG